MPPILTGLGRRSGLRGDLMINNSITPLVHSPKVQTIAPKYCKADNSCSPDFPSTLQEPLHATFQQADCMVGSDSRTFVAGVSCKPYLVFNPKWYGSWGGCGDWGSGSHHSRRPDNFTKLKIHQHFLVNSLQHLGSLISGVSH